MSLELELEAARDAAESLVGDGEQVAAVMASEPGLAARVYLIAFEADGEHSYLALGADLSPVRDRRLVRDAVVMLALAERAEEASVALQAEQLEQEFATAERALRAAHPAEAAAAADVRSALLHLAEVADGPRVATPLYLDTIGAASGRLAVALVGFRDQVELLTAPGAAPSPAVEAAWRALGIAAGAGDPSQFSHSMTATTAAAEALADDVLERLRPV
ncbi:MAG TPA: hypothetical protein VFD61_10080 [Gaiellales bacterium]|nr:hypothetical protein [Gaiellales bacterium]